jgi:WhiB family redox-sensing transcriptional regulator
MTPAAHTGPPPDLRHYTDTWHTRDWMRLAACKDHDPELWFPHHAHNRHERAVNRYATEAAQRICLDCPAIADCLHYALDTDTRYGIWGGATPTDRARLTGRRAYG